MFFIRRLSKNALYDIVFTKSVRNKNTKEYSKEEVFLAQNIDSNTTALLLLALRKTGRINFRMIKLINKSKKSKLTLKEAAL